jgi:hypothetical protein
VDLSSIFCGSFVDLLWIFRRFSSIFCGSFVDFRRFGSVAVGDIGRVGFVASGPY